MTSILMMLGLGLVFVFLLIGVYLHIQKRNTKKKPSVMGVSSLALQIILLLLFFTDTLAGMPEKLFDTIWLIVIGGGFVFGIREFRHNSIVALLTILLSLLLSIFLLLILVIGSM